MAISHPICQAQEGGVSAFRLSSILKLGLQYLEGMHEIFNKLFGCLSTQFSTCDFNGSNRRGINPTIICKCSMANMTAPIAYRTLPIFFHMVFIIDIGKPNDLLDHIMLDVIVSCAERETQVLHKIADDCRFEIVAIDAPGSFIGCN